LIARGASAASRREATMMTLTLLQDGQVAEVTARFDGERVRIPADTLAAATGWALKPEGLCRGAMCEPVADPAALANDEGVDLQAFAERLGRPLALDVAERAAALGTAADERERSLASGEAPDFTLHDLAGRAHTLSAHRGKKVLLIAYASW
jgi:hypothetical protein